MCKPGLMGWTALLIGSRRGLDGSSRGGGRGLIDGACWGRGGGRKGGTWREGVEARRRARAYRRGLLAPVERKNGWQLAEAVGDATPDGVPDFLSRVQWEADAVRDDLQAYVVQHLGDPDGVAILDG